MRTDSVVTILRVCASEGACVFTTQSSVSFTFSVQTVAYSLIVVKTSQRNVFIGVEEKKKKDFTVVVKPLFMSIYYPITNLLSVYT